MLNGVFINDYIQAAQPQENVLAQEERRLWMEHRIRAASMGLVASRWMRGPTHVT